MDHLGKLGPFRPRVDVEVGAGAERMSTGSTAESGTQTRVWEGALALQIQFADAQSTVGRDLPTLYVCSPTDAACRVPLELLADGRRCTP